MIATDLSSAKLTSAKQKFKAEWTAFAELTNGRDEESAALDERSPQATP